MSLSLGQIVVGLIELKWGGSFHVILLENVWREHFTVKDKIALGRKLCVTNGQEKDTNGRVF